jgi:type I restriction enzyme S subunit
MGQSPPSSSYNEKGDGLPFFQGKADFGELNPKIRIWCNQPIKIAEINDILISVRAPVGSLNICNTKSCIGRGLAVLRVSSKINHNYLFHYLKSIETEITQKSRGSTFDSINQTDLKSIEIPIFPIEQQIQIAFILDTVELIRRARNWNLIGLTAFRAAYFLEIFGDPANNPQNWEMTTLDKLMNFMTSGSRGWAKYYSDEGSLFLRIQNVGQNRLLLDDPTFVNPPNDAEAKRTKVQPKDLLISVTADLGRTAIIPDGFGTAYINQHLVLVRLKTKEVNPYFAASYITSDRNIQVKNLSKGGVKAGLNFNDIGAIKIPIVPIELQNHFEKVCLEVEQTRNKLEEYLKQTENLQKSLLQKAFSGTLEIDEKAWKRLDTEGWVKNYIETGSPTPKPYEPEFIPLPIESFTIETNGKKTEYSNIGNMLTDVKNYATEAFGKKGYFTFEALEKVLHEQTQIQYPYKELKDYIFRELDRKDGWFEQEFLLDEKRDKSKGTDDSRIVFRIKEQVPPQ